MNSGSTPSRLSSPLMIPLPSPHPSPNNNNNNNNNNKIGDIYCNYKLPAVTASSISFTWDDVYIPLC